MFRNCFKPLHPRILHRHIRIETACDSVRDGRLTLFREQFEELFLLGNQGVNLAGFAVKEGSDGELLIPRRDWQCNTRQIRCVNSGVTYASRTTNDSVDERRTLKGIFGEAGRYHI
ncbi:hypothetical protein WK33_17865 [Burkholderia multivorans]|nr:hypothetical protein WK33_17865 [Burkholderia multivorans]